MAIASAVIANAAAQETARVETKTFDSEYFPFEREVFIYTPANYDEATQSDYDVIYVFDSQWRSRFDLVQSLMHYGCQNEDNDGGVLSYIVVGVTSPSSPELKSDRGRDFLPDTQTFENENGYYNSANFRKYLKNEVIPYINSNYRSTGHSLGIGHSLGGSFVLDALCEDDMFDDCIALSPNLAWDEGRFGKTLMDYDFNASKPRFIYMTMANESVQTGWPEDWRPAWDKVKDHFDNTTLPEHINMTIKENPRYSHNASYQPALIDALREYAVYSRNRSDNPGKLYPVHIELNLPDITDDVYITGNQPALADWNAAGTKMEKLNDTTYAIDLDLTLPAEFKFTRGSWDFDKQIFIKNAQPDNLRISDPAHAVKHYEGFTIPVTE